MIELIGQRSSLVLSLALAACQSVALQAKPQAAQTTRESLPSEHPPSVTTPVPILAEPELAKRDELFLVHAAGGEIVIRSVASDLSRVLVPHAHAALYQPELELLWFREHDRLAVVDLRDDRAPTTIIARGLPEDASRLSISRGAQMVDANDGCDLAYISLDWSDKPKIEAILTEAPELRLEDNGWLVAAIGRPARKVGKDREFGDGQIRLPKKLSDCEDVEVCGTTGMFGGRGSELVLVQEKTGGDCLQRACLLHDAKTDQFATPPRAEEWGPAKGTARGPCGPYSFDRAGMSFLIDNLLCVPEAGCRDLGGRTLGWFVPGDSVGGPGLGNFGA